MKPTTIAALALASLVTVGPSFAAESTVPNTTRETAAPAKNPAASPCRIMLPAASCRLIGMPTCSR
jgi:hypothetical protein